MTEEDLILEIKENIIHMTGAGRHIPTANRGHRNQLCATIGSHDHKVMMEAVRMELCTVRLANPQLVPNSDYFFATREGCNFAGLPAKVIARIFPK